MAYAFVQATDENHRPVVAEMLHFDFLPRVGEHIFTDDGTKHYLLLVKLVRHFPTPVKGREGSGESAHLECELLESGEL